MTQSLSNREQCTHPGKLVVHRRLAGKAHKKKLVEVHAASRPAATSVLVVRTTSSGLVAKLTTWQSGLEV
jgi:hypothetical protein